MFQIVDLLTSQGKSVAVLTLSYDLAPGAVYPRQLQQAASLFNHVLHTLKYDPANIVFAGDSAGGNLALSLLSHIAHPHPSGTVPKVELQGKLAGAVLISPWIDFNLDTSSFTTNKYKDCIDRAAVDKWSASFLGSSPLDNYNQAGIAPASWWEDLPVEKVLVLAGGDEVLVDGIVKFEETFKRGFGAEKVELLVAKGEFHDEAYIGMQINGKKHQDKEQAKLIKRWIGAKL
jgi:acetyl esterase/lipase